MACPASTSPGKETRDGEFGPGASTAVRDDDQKPPNMKPKTLTTSLFLALVTLASERAATAQFSRARSDFEKVRSAQGTLNLDRDRAEQAGVAKNLYEYCGALMDSLTNCGRELSEFGSNFADQRGKPRRAIAVVRGQAETSRAALDAWMRKLAGTENHKSEGEKVLAQINELSKQWNEMTRAVDETRSWLTEGLRNATRDRERITQDCRPVEDAQNAAMTRYQNACRSAKRAEEEHDRALERVVAAEQRENESYERYSQTVTRGGTNEEAANLRAAWARFAREENEALAAAFNAFQAALAARDELKAAYGQLASSQREMVNYATATDANRIVENYNFFVRWNELFEKDFR